MAKNKKYKPMTDTEVLVALETLIQDGSTFHDSELSKERTKVQKYYDGDEPVPSHKGNSKFVSQDVFDSVESMKTALLETFAAGRNIVAFTPNGEEDVSEARIATAYCDYVMFSKNDGFAIMQDVIHDSLTSRIGVAEYGYDKRIEKIEETFEDLVAEDVDALLMQEGVTLVDYEVDEETGLFSGTIEREEDHSQIWIETVPPEEFIVQSKAKTLDKSACARRMLMTRSDLLKEGYTDDQLDEIGNGSEGQEGWEDDPEVLARFDGIGASRSSLNDIQDQLKRVWVYRCYIDLDIEGTGKTKLWKITKAGNTILDKEQVLKRPFVTFSPLPRPHSLIGSNYAAKVIDTQNAKTVLTRGILDHTVTTNNPRYTVVKNGLMNPKELMDNRVGGIVNTTRPDAVAPLLQAPLNPFVFQTLELLDYRKEDTTGVSKLSQGLNKDAVSKQNSQGMVEQLTSMSQQRQKVIARNFANQFLVPLFLDIYELALEKVDKEEIIEVAGEYVPVTPASWRARRDVTVELHLGYGEQEREAQSYFALDQMLSQDPKAQPLYTLDKKYNLLKTAWSKKGVKNISDYLVHPEQVQPPQPDPKMVAELEALKMQNEIAMRAQMLAEEKFKLEAAIKQKELELNDLKIRSNFALQSDKQDLAEREQKHHEKVDMAELALAKQATDLKGIASPTG